MSDLKYLLAIHRGLNLTLPRYHKLKTAFCGHWDQCFSAKMKDWQAAGMDKKGLEKWFIARSTLSPEQELTQLESAQAHCLIYGEENYPLALGHTSSPPVLLFVRGRIEECDWPSLAIVGSRRVTQYGRRTIEHLAAPIAQAGITIVSGLAYGVDTLAHQIALDNGARTLAVLGCGIDQIYPQSNQSLGQKIQTQGALISEFLPGIKARPEHFPMRNRIIAGLTQGTLVIEAAAKSGSLITAQYALEANREVFAVPGEIFSSQAIGTNRLLEQGAHLALDGQAILENLGISPILAPEKVSLPTQGLEAEILNIFTEKSPLHIDEITLQSGFPGNTVRANLMLMEMKNWVKNLGGQIYVKNV